MTGVRSETRLALEMNALMAGFMTADENVQRYRNELKRLTLEMKAFMHETKSLKARVHLYCTCNSALS